MLSVTIFPPYPYFQWFGQFPEPKFIVWPASVEATVPNEAWQGASVQCVGARVWNIRSPRIVVIVSYIGFGEALLKAIGG
jgi:hypothetical protein